MVIENIAIPGRALRVRNRLKGWRNTVTSGGPVTVTVTEPIPCYRSREGLLSVCLAIGNQRRSCYRSRGTSLCHRSQEKVRPALFATENGR